ncbi:MAG TPA: hypothetical protein VGA04_35040 [Streptosporangiaceae bacterium]
MDNTYQPPGADPQDRQPTEQFWPMNSPAAGHEGSYGPGYGPGPGYRPAAGHSYQAQEPPGVRQHLARDRRKALHWTVGITVAAILAGAGLIAGEAWAGSPGSGASGPTGAAATLNATLSSADSSSTPSPAPAASATGTASTGTGSAAAPAATATTQPCARAAAAAKAAKAAGRPRAAEAARLIAGHCRAGRLRIARLLGGIDGQFTFRTKTGFRTLAYERGVIETVTSGSDIVVRASDGTTWTWKLVSNTVVREKGAKTAESALAPGQAVWVGGPVTSVAKDARLIVIRPPASTSSPTPSGSGS